MIKLSRFILFTLMVFMFTTTTISAVTYETEYDYTLDKDFAALRLPIPKTYVMERTLMDFGNEVGSLNDVQDLFIDKKDNLYIVDAGNNRIIKCNVDGTVEQVFQGAGKLAMKHPEGLYVYGDGDMFVADTENQRIIHLSPKGDFIEEFLKPQSDMLESSFVYNPRKVVVSSTGYIYSIKFQLLMQMDADNEFRGYVGSTQVGFSLTRFLVDRFGSEIQKSKMSKAMPAAYSNFVLGRDGLFYATTLDYDMGQIKKLTSTGKNIFPVKSFGENIMNAQGYSEKPVFDDIAVDENGIITVCERLSARLYQYDQEGNLLSVFGGKGTNNNQLSQPRCIEVDSKGKIYVYDVGRNEICVFEPTLFIKQVHTAVTSYNLGAYDKALSAWAGVLASCETYSLAQVGIGKTYFKQEKYEQAMTAFKLANDKTQYSKTFDKYRYGVMQNIFPQLIFIIIIICVSLFFLIKYLRRLSDYLEMKYMKKRGRG